MKQSVRLLTLYRTVKISFQSVCYLALTFAAFFYIKRLQQRTGWMLLNPILIAIVLIIVYLKITGVSFAVYKQGAQLIDFWLKPAVVALGVPLYLQLDAIKTSVVTNRSVTVCWLFGGYCECCFRSTALWRTRYYRSLNGK